MSDTNRILLSDDGSNTLISEKFGVTYHSKFGALEESLTVFLSAGLQYQYLRGCNPIRIFEMGFGTGFNAFLTYIEATRLRTSISYTGIELYPISLEDVRAMNYPQLLNKAEELPSFLRMHETAPDIQISMSSFFEFTRIEGDILDLKTHEQFDIIYYDAFAPSAQEELWTEKMLKKMYTFTAPGGIMVTYCAKGSFKRALKAAGYRVEVLPGPGKKREMTRAIKPL